jgi:hypothetical protein
VSLFSCNTQRGEWQVSPSSSAFIGSASKKSWIFPGVESP